MTAPTDVALQALAALDDHYATVGRTAQGERMQQLVAAYPVLAALARAALNFPAVVLRCGAEGELFCKFCPGGDVDGREAAVRHRPLCVGGNFLDALRRLRDHGRQMGFDDQ